MTKITENEIELFAIELLEKQGGKTCKISEKMVYFSEIIIEDYP